MKSEKKKKNKDKKNQNQSYYGKFDERDEGLNLINKKKIDISSKLLIFFFQ